MKVQTINGPVELTAEMIRPGMVIEKGNGDIFMCARRLHGNAWSDPVRGAFTPTESNRVLGCDPAIASRADCVTYGIAPGIDAGKHGFARLRDGGALDAAVDTLPVGSIVAEADGFQIMVMPETRRALSLTDGERFIGLDASHASPADVRRLCCWEDTNWKNGVAMSRCSLAIGDHDMHEDIETGVKWKAADQRPICGNCGAPAHVDEFGQIMVSLPTDDGKHAKSPICKTCDVDHREDWDRMMIRGGRIVPKTEKVVRTLRDAEGELLDKIGEVFGVKRGVPKPGTPEWICAKVRKDGYECELTRAPRGTGTLGVKVFGGSVEYCKRLFDWLALEMPRDACFFVEAAPAKTPYIQFNANRPFYDIQQMPRKPAPHKIGWYSREMSQFGSWVWRTPDGRSVEVTHVSETEAHSLGWPDVVRVGEVTECVGKVPSPLLALTSSLSPPAKVDLAYQSSKELGATLRACKQGFGVSDATPACSSCGCKRTCPWRTESRVDADAVPCDECGCMWCGPRRCDAHRTSAVRCCLPSGHTLEPHRDVIGNEWGDAREKQMAWTTESDGSRTARHGDSFASMGPDGHWYVSHRGVVIRASANAHHPEDAARWFLTVVDVAPALTALLIVLQFISDAWTYSKAGQLAARDAAVAKAIADVPAGCDANGWANVVHVLAADANERAIRRGGTTADDVRLFLVDVNDARPTVTLYARLRFVHGYGRAESIRFTLASMGCSSCKFTERLLAAYEAGR